MKRQLIDYEEKFYSKLSVSATKMQKDSFELARKISEWKLKVMRSWDSIEVLEMNVFDTANKALTLGKNFEAEIKLNLHELSTADIGIEVVFIETSAEKTTKKIIFKTELTSKVIDKKIVLYECKIPATRTGVYEYAFRLFPKNEMLPYKQDFNLLKWI